MPYTRSYCTDSKPGVRVEQGDTLSFLMTGSEWGGDPLERDALFRYHEEQLRRLAADRCLIIVHMEFLESFRNREVSTVAYVKEYNYGSEEDR